MDENFDSSPSQAVFEELGVKDVELALTWSRSLTVGLVLQDLG